MIAVALALIGLVVMIATGVAASSTSGDHLTFLGVGVQTTTAQVFLTGAIFGWVFVIALWLLRLGMRRSGERCAQLAARRSRRVGAWFGFGFGDAETDRDGWDGWNEWGVAAPLDPDDAWPDESMGRNAATGQARGARSGNVWLRAAVPLDLDGVPSDGIAGPAGHGRGSQAGPGRVGKAAPLDRTCALPDRIAGVAGDGRRVQTGSDSSGRASPTGPGGALSDGIVGLTGHGHRSQVGGGFGEAGPCDLDGGLPGGALSDGLVGWAGAARHGRGAPWRADERGDQANRAVAGAVEEPGALGGGYSAGPVAGRLPGGGVSGGAEGGEVGRGTGSVAGEDGGAEGEDRAGEGRQ
jgi:hypothetical protein